MFFEKLHARFNEGAKGQPLLFLVLEVVAAIVVIVLFSLNGCSEYQTHLQHSQAYLQQADGEAYTNE